MRLEIRHETEYRYATPVRHSIQYLRLTPRADAGQRVIAWRIDAPGRSSSQTDAYSNAVTVLSLDEPHASLRISVTGTVETFLTPGSPLANESPLPPVAFLVPTRLTEADDAIRAIAVEALGARGAQLDGVLRLGDLVTRRVVYEPGSTDVDHTAAQALALGRGVCQDYTHVVLAACRAVGLPARYVSGYFDAGDPGHLASHAWVDVWIEGAGWIGYDPTHACLAGERYCRLAVGRDYLDASPVRGMRHGGTEERLSVVVTVAVADQ